MWYAKALKNGVVGKDFSGKEKQYALYEESLIRDEDLNWYRSYPGVFSVFENTKFSPVKITPSLVIAPANPATIGQAGGYSRSDSPAQWTASVSPRIYNGKPMMRITNVTGADAFCYLYKKVAMNTIDVPSSGIGGKIELPIFMDSVNSAGAYFRFNVSDIEPTDPPANSIPAVNRQVNFLSNEIKYDDFQILSADLSAIDANCFDLVNGTGFPTGSVTQPDYSNLKWVAWRVVLPAGKWVDVGDLAIGGRAAAVMLNIFDGAINNTHIGRVAQAFADRGIKACFSIQGQNIAGYASAIRQAVAMGHELANEGLNHTTYSTFGNSTTQLAADVAQANANYDALGLPTDSYRKIFAAASNSLTTPQIAYLKSIGYRVIRSGNRSLTPISSLGAETLTPIGQFGIGGMTLARAKRVTDASILHGEACLRLYHTIPLGATGTSTGTDFVWDDFLALLDYDMTFIQQGRMVNMGLLEFADFMDTLKK